MGGEKLPKTQNKGDVTEKTELITIRGGVFKIYRLQHKGGCINMRKRTTTGQINAALSNNLLQIIRVECYNKSTYKATNLNNDIFNENLQFINESGILAECIGWTFEKLYDSNREYIFETGRMNPESNCIATVYVQVLDSVSLNELEEMLVVEDIKNETEE